MKIPGISEPELLFSVDAVEGQLEKIFRDPHFTESAILKKFLSFIVRETILGRSNCLKEYTIAVNVLDKPHNFNPQENGIVRIHAGRLRRALGQYYDEMGHNDHIVITIPKGKYVPVFANRLSMNDSFIDGDFHSNGIKNDEEGRIILAVLPFIYATKDAAVKSFAEGLCLQMSTMLTRVSQISVIAYQALKNLEVLHPDFREMGTALGFNHIISGGVQSLKNKVRVSLQLIECTSYRLKWTETFERQLTKSNFFEIEDEICERVMEQLEALSSKGCNEQRSLPVAL